MTGPEPSPSTTIDRLVDGVYPAMALLAGMQLDLFSAIADGAASTEEIADRRGLDPSKTKLLLDALVAAELLTKNVGRYQLTAESADHLVSSSPWSRVEGHAVLGRLWEAGLHTADTVRTGRPSDAYDYGNLDPDDALELLRGLRADSTGLVTLLLDELKLEAGMTVADVGGGAGGAAATITELVPEVDAVVIELPSIASACRTLLTEAGHQHIDVIEADCTEEVPGSYDRIWVQFVTQTMSGDDAEALINNAASSLHPAGSLHLVNIVVNAVRTTPKRAALFNIPLSNLYREGQAHSVADYERWLRGVGLTDITWRPVNDMVQLVSARRG